MTESTTDLGYVLFAHGDEALKFAVKAIDKSDSIDEPLNQCPIWYTFSVQTTLIHSGTNRWFTLKVSKNFTRVHGMKSANSHDRAIRAGLKLYSESPNEHEFILTSEVYVELESRLKLIERKLRLEILKFMFVVYQRWPRETITQFDVGDNLFANEQEIVEWLQDLKDEGAITKGNSKVDMRRGVTTGGYRIDPKSRKATEEVLASALAESARHRSSDRPYLFLSYSTKDKAIAGKIKAELETRGFDVFLAHEDIRPSDEWKDEILKALDQCNAFLPLLTNRFRYSQWTDQEAGIALAKDKLIVPIKITRNPLGFISSKQAISFNDQDTVGSCEEIVELLNEKLNYSPA